MSRRLGLPIEERPLNVMVISHALIQKATWVRWRLLAQRYDVKVTLLIPERWRSNWFGDAVTMISETFHERNFAVLSLPVLQRDYSIGYVFKSFDLHLRRIQPDVIYVVQEELTPVLHQVIECRRLWCPSAKLLFFSWNNLAVSRGTFFQRLLWAHTVHHADGAFVGSSEALRVLQEAGFSKQIYIQTEIGVDAHTFSPNDSMRNATRRMLGLKDFVIGFAGRITRDKGVFDLVQACASLDGNWQLLFVGSGHDEEALKTECRTHGVAERVSFVGTVPFDTMPDYMRAMDCLVLPSRTTARWKEQFGLVLAQAMACKVPVVGASSGAIPEVIGDAGLVYPEGNLKALARCLQLMIEDEKARLHYAEKGYTRFKSHWSAESLAEETYKILRSLTC